MPANDNVSNSSLEITRARFGRIRTNDACPLLWSLVWRFWIGVRALSGERKRWENRRKNKSGTRSTDTNWWCLWERRAHESVRPWSPRSRYKNKRVSDNVGALGTIPYRTQTGLVRVSWRRRSDLERSGPKGTRLIGGCIRLGRGRWFGCSSKIVSRS